MLREGPGIAVEPLSRRLVLMYSAFLAFWCFLHRNQAAATTPATAAMEPIVMPATLPPLGPELPPLLEVLVATGGAVGV